MSAEITKKIEEKYPYENQTPEMIAINACKREGAEFGYQLGYEQAMKELTRQAIDANSVKPVFDRAAIPYQLCPKCNGNKWTKNKNKSLGTFCSCLEPQPCDICNGAGIIPMDSESKEPKP